MINKEAFVFDLPSKRRKSVHERIIELIVRSEKAHAREMELEIARSHFTHSHATTLLALFAHKYSTVSRIRKSTTTGMTY